MGWGSATETFDGAVSVALKFIPTVNDSHAEIVIKAVVEAMYTQVRWEDWDTQDESDYFPYLIDVMHELDELYPGYYEWYHSEDQDNFDWSKYSGH